VIQSFSKSLNIFNVLEVCEVIIPQFPEKWYSPYKFFIPKNENPLLSLIFEIYQIVMSRIKFKLFLPLCHNFLHCEDFANPKKQNAESLDILFM